MHAERRRTRWADAPLALWLLMMPIDIARGQSLADQLVACKDERRETQARIAACTGAIGEAKGDEDILTEVLLTLFPCKKRRG